MAKAGPEQAERVAHLKQGHGLQEELADGVKGQPERTEAAEQRAGEDVPLRRQMTPAMSWASPPNMNATAKTTGVVPAGTMLALIRLSINVVTAKAARASGAELPHPDATTVGA